MDSKPKRQLCDSGLTRLRTPIFDTLFFCVIRIRLHSTSYSDSTTMMVSNARTLSIFRMCSVMMCLSFVHSFSFHLCNNIIDSIICASSTPSTALISFRTSTIEAGSVIMQTKAIGTQISPKQQLCHYQYFSVSSLKCTIIT
jgi:hypothetical protein